MDQLPSSNSERPVTSILMVLSDELSYGDVFAVMEDAAQAVPDGRNVNPTILTHDEFRKRVKRRDWGCAPRVCSRSQKYG